MMNNRRKLTAWVAAQIAFARDKSPDAARRYLDAHAERLNDDIYCLAKEDPTPKHLVGLTVFDLANARDELGGAVPKEAA